LIEAMVETEVAQYGEQHPIRDDDQVADELLVHKRVHTHCQRADCQRGRQRDERHDLEIDERLESRIPLGQLHGYRAERGDEHEYCDRKKDRDQLTTERHPRRDRRCVLQLIRFYLPLAPHELTTVERREENRKDEHPRADSRCERRRDRPARRLTGVRLKPEAHHQIDDANDRDREIRWFADDRSQMERTLGDERAHPARAVVSQRDGRSRRRGCWCRDDFRLRFATRAAVLQAEAEYERDNREQRERNGDPDRTILQHRPVERDQARVLFGDAPVTDDDIDRCQRERIDEGRELELVELTNDGLRDLPREQQHDAGDIHREQLSRQRSHGE
jgi:hypothetical protein